MSDYVLEVLDGELKGRVISLGSERLTLGRRPNNDVVLKDEKASGNHAEIVREGDAFVLRDLDSRNGTFLDGRKITELSLSPGDVFKIGLTTLCFRREGEAAVVPATAAVDAEGLSVHRIDQARLQRVKRGGGMLGMVVALVAVVGAGAWVWFRYGRPEAGTAPVRGAKAETAIPGNLLAVRAATFDDEAAWDLRAAGAGCSVGGPAHSGANALLAGGDGAPAPFAVARTSELLRVVGDDNLELSAQVQCENGARVALRVLFSSSREEDTFTLLASTPLFGPEAWERVSGSLTVPAGLDRARVEVVALLPGADAAARVDDVALVRAGSGERGALTAHNGARMMTSGASAAVLLVQDVLVQALCPLTEAGSPLHALDGAARATLAEAGGTLSATVQDDRFLLTVGGVGGFALEVPSADGLLVRSGPDAPFAPAPADFATAAQEILVGSGNSRMLVTTESPLEVRGHASARGYRLQFPQGTGALGLVVFFGEQRGEASNRVRIARQAAQEGRFAAALAPLQEVVERFPHDDSRLAEAQELRAQILAGLSAKLDKLAQDLDTAKFFAARSGLARVLADLDEIVRVYGEDNLGRPELVQRVRTEAAATIAELDAQQMAQRLPGLRSLAEAMEEAGQSDLAQVITGYLTEQERNK